MDKHPWTLGLVCSLSVAFLLSHASARRPNAELTLSHQERSPQPGEVILLTVDSSTPLKEVEGRALNRKIVFYPLSDSSAWQGLLGIDLEVKPGTYPVEVKAWTPTGTTLGATSEIAVKGKRFPTREVKVEEKYVTPPNEALERIKRESQITSQIFSAVTPQKLWDGPFTSPVPGASVSGFGTRSIFNGQPRSPHGGVDLHAGEGTPVKAPNSGKVVLASNLYFSGNTVIVDHGLGLYSYFAHLSRIAVAEGTTVSSGDLVGYVGATGRASGPHLHWAVQLNRARVDPFSLISVLSSGGQKSQSGQKKPQRSN